MNISSLSRRLCLGVLFPAAIAALAGCAAGLDPAAESSAIGTAEEAEIITVIPLYRLYNAMTNHHFYTTFMKEAFEATRTGYAYESVAGQCLPQPRAGSVPLFRLYNATTQDHFYTTNMVERDLAVTTLGYVNEGIACFIYSASTPGTCPFYRLRNPATNDHFYTMSGTEALRATQLGYVLEGYAGFLYPDPGQGCPP